MKNLLLITALLLGACGPSTLEDYMGACMAYCVITTNTCGRTVPQGCEAYCIADRGSIAWRGQDCLEASIDYRECQVDHPCEDRACNGSAEVAADECL